MPALTFDLNMKNVAAAGLRVGQTPHVIQREMVTTMGHGFVGAETTAKANARVDLGSNQRSIHAQVRASSGVIEGRLIANARNSAVMELGRRPGAKMPPKGVLLGWLLRRGIDAKAEYPIRRKIGRDGIKGDHNLERTVRKLVVPLGQALAQIGPRVVRKALEGL